MSFNEWTDTYICTYVCRQASGLNNKAGWLAGWPLLLGGSVDVETKAWFNNKYVCTYVCIFWKRKESEPKHITFIVGLSTKIWRCVPSSWLVHVWEERGNKRLLLRWWMKKLRPGGWVKFWTEQEQFHFQKKHKTHVNTLAQLRHSRRCLLYRECVEPRHRPQANFGKERAGGPRIAASIQCYAVAIRGMESIRLVDRPSF